MFVFAIAFVIILICYIRQVSKPKKIRLNKLLQNNSVEVPTDYEAKITAKKINDWLLPFEWDYQLQQLQAVWLFNTEKGLRFYNKNDTVPLLGNGINEAKFWIHHSKAMIQSYELSQQEQRMVFPEGIRCEYDDLLNDRSIPKYIRNTIDSICSNEEECNIFFGKSQIDNITELRNEVTRLNSVVDNLIKRLDTVDYPLD